MNLWNRNEVVADPTYVGNVLGLVVLGVPAAALELAVFWPLSLLSPDRFRGVGFGPVAMTLTGSSLVGGFLFGTPFIPLSLLFEEDPPKCPDLC